MADLEAPASRERRALISGCAALATVACVPGCLSRGVRPQRFAEDPFRLGVASGYPTANAVVLWTRLALDPRQPAAGLDPVDVPVDWEVALDERFARIVRRGSTYARPQEGHSVHVVADGLESDRMYWYRFLVGGNASPAGRTRTSPVAHAPVDRRRLAIASCQHYEQGYYGAYRQLVDDEPDLIVHVGDYIYEGTTIRDGVRSHGGAECYTLDDYRNRYAIYKSDPALQSAHAACPWLVMWDDHEVDNDYAGDIGEHDEDSVAFAARRMAAYHAYYENMPLPPAARPAGSGLQLYCRRSIGALADDVVLDQRQYRSPHACPPPGRRGATRVRDCPELALQARTQLGERQEAWLARELPTGSARWTLLAQGTLMTYFDEEPGSSPTFWTDSWNGYPAARQRFVDLVASRLANPVVLSGDIHAFLVSELNAVPGRPETPVVAPEFTTTSISSRGLPQAKFDASVPANPNILLADARHRGYLTLDLGPGRLEARLIAMDSVTSPQSRRRVLASYVVDAGRAEPVRDS
jgi:alkaline phosphatase D